MTARFNPYFADVSSAQPHVNMDEYAAAGHLAIAIKASEGVSYINPYHRGQALAAGGKHVAVIHYHFGRPDQGNAPDAEAAHFLDAAKQLAGPYDYLVLDLEEATRQGWKGDPLWSQEFDHRVRDGSRFRVILYASRSTLQISDHWLVNEPASARRVWDADWSTGPDYAPPGYQCVFRQFTNGFEGPGPHSFAGIGRCDGNRMNRAILQHLTQYR